MLNSAPDTRSTMTMTHQSNQTNTEPPQLDENQFRQDLTELIPHLRAFARSLCQNAATADDIAQDTMLKAWKARNQFKPGTNLKAWTFTILRNRFYSYKRRSWRATPLDQEVAEQTIVANSNPEKSIELNDLRRGLDSLPDDQREALILVGASGLSYDEAAEICECAVGTIKSRVSRARKALTVIMETAAFENDKDDISALNAFDEILSEADDIASD